MKGIYLFDNKENLIKSISPDLLLENTQTQELCSQITASCKFPYKDFDEDSEYFGVKEDNNFWLYKIRKKSKESGYIILDGIHIFFDELKGKVVRDIRNQNSSANLVVEKIISGTGWELKSNLTGKIASQNYYYQSALSAFYDAVKTWDFEFIPEILFKDGKIISKKINIYDELSKDYGKCYWYGDRLISVVAESSTDELYTAFIGRGKGIPIEDENGNKTGGFSRKIKFNEIEYTNEKDGIKVYKPKGIDYIEIKEATKAYGYPDGTPRIGVVDFDDIEDRILLAKMTFDYAIENSRPKLQLKATALERDKIELGEIVTIVRPDMNIRYKVRVFKIQKDFLKDKVVSFEFGDKIIKSAGERLKSELYDKRKRAEEIDSYIDSLRDEINSSYFNDSAYNYDLKIGNKYNLPAGYYSFDRPIDENPTKVIYMGAGKMLVANKKNPDGSWKWGTMATGEGVVAESIVGTLGEFAKVNAYQINVNNEFADTALGKKIGSELRVIDNKIVDETGKIRDDLKIIDDKVVDATGKIRDDLKITNGKITDLEGNVIYQDVLYNNVKITGTYGIQVLDNYGRERVQLGNWAYGRYGLNLKDASGNKTILDDEGILQSWQDSVVDNIDNSHPLRIHLYLPSETARIYKAKLRLFFEPFRAYQKGNKSTEGTFGTTSDGGGGYSGGTSSDGGAAWGTLTSDVDSYIYGSQGGHNHAIAHLTQLGSPGGGYAGTFQQSGNHTHNVYLDIRAHSHNFNIDIPSHSHQIFIPGHTHEPIFGIFETYGNAQYEVFINGIDRTAAISGSGYITSNQTDLDIESYLNKNAWNIVEIKATDLSRVSATVFMQVLMNYGGY